MSDSLKAFPTNDVEALAYLYVKSQDLSTLTPSQIYDKYRNAYKEIQNHKTQSNSGTVTARIMKSPI